MHEQNPMNQIWPKCTKSSKTPIFLWCENFRRMHEKCINACNLIKKKEKTCLTLGFRRKPLKLWPRKRPKKKKRVRRNRREKQRNSEKGLSDSYYFFFLKKNEIRMVGRNQDRNWNSLKNRLDWLKEIGKESSKPESFNLKLEFSFSFSIDQKTNLINRILKKQNFWKIWKIFL